MLAFSQVLSEFIYCISRVTDAHGLPTHINHQNTEFSEANFSTTTAPIKNPKCDLKFYEAVIKLNVVLSSIVAGSGEG